MISCAAIQKLERYGYLGLKRHSTEDFVATSIKDAKRVNVYALTLLETWKEAVQAVHGHSDGADEATLMAAPARFTDALVYAMSFAVALTTQHVMEVSSVKCQATASSSSSPLSSSSLFPDDYVAALQLLTTLKDMGLAIGTGRALRRNAASDDFTKAAAHLLTNVLDLVLVLLSTHTTTTAGPHAAVHEQMLAQGLVLTASVAQMLRRVQASYPVADLYNTRTCSALLKQVANKYKQQQKNKQPANTAAHGATLAKATGAKKSPQEVEQLQQEPLFELLRRYVFACTQHSSSAVISAASLFSVFSLFQRISVLHGALSAVAARPAAFAPPLCRASEDVQHWLSQLLSTTACNRATRYVVYFREDELRLMQHNIRQASDYALYTVTTTPPVDPGVVESLLGTAHLTGAAAAAANATEGTKADAADAVTHARAALVLAQWCVSAPFFFESFCQDETWAAFAQEQRRLVLLQQSRARRGLEKSAKSRKDRRGTGGDDGEGEATSSTKTSRASSVSSRSSDTKSVKSNDSNGSAHHNADTASLRSFQTASHLGNDSVGGSVTSLASRVSLLSTFSKHSAASYLSFISLLRPSTTGSVAGGATGRMNGGEAEEDGFGGAERQMHESEDGNTNLPLILLEQLTLGLHRFMETYPVELLDAYGLRSISWSCIARMFAFVEASLTHVSTALAATTLPQPLFTLAQDIRYNKGMGYECLGLLFAKAVAPLLDVNGGATTASRPAITANEEAPVPSAQTTKTTKKPLVADSSSSSEDGEDGEDAARKSDDEDVRSVDGDRTEEGFFANAAAASAAVGRASLSVHDDAATRRSIEESLSTCLTAYETVAPQVVDMNLATILRLAARTAAAAATATTATATATVAWSEVLIAFLRDITRRLGRNNELPHFVDALLGRGDAAAAATSNGTTLLSETAEAADLAALRSVFHLSSVRRALTEAAGMSLDPESLLLHLTSIAAEVEEGVGAVEPTVAAHNASSSSNSDSSSSDAEDEEASTPISKAAKSISPAQMQRTMLTLEVMAAVLEGVAPTSVSATAVLEQTTQLELLLTSSFMKCVEAAASQQDQQRQRLVIVQHACTIRQCRAVTALCLQDLGSQQVQEYLLMLDETLWQLSTDIGLLIGSLTLTDLQKWLDDEDEQVDTAASPLVLLLPSLVLQRLSLARAVTAALGTTAGPAAQLQEMVAYIWTCIAGTNNHTSKQCTHGCATQPTRQDYVSMLLANEMSSEDWASVVALGKEKHARAAMMALLARSSAMAVTTTGAWETAWMRCCLKSIPGATLRAIVDVYVTLSVEELCEGVQSAATSAARPWTAMVTSLVGAYEVVGHNPYWPTVLTHTVRAVAHLTRVWRKAAKDSNSSSSNAVSRYFSLVAEQLLGLVVCVLRSEPRAAEVLRKALLSQLRESAAAAASSAPAVPVLSRSGMSVAYVESIKVPATVLSDLGAPASLAEADVDDDARAAQLAAFRDLSFEEELRDLSGLLFHAGFVKQLFTLSDLAAPAGCGTSSTCMAALAYLYQVALGTTQMAWRARVTDGSLEGLRQTDAVVFLHAVAAAFHRRTQSDAAGAAGSTALIAFLEPFSGESTENHLLFLHIASQRTAATAATVTVSTDGGALDSVESYWKCILCHTAMAAMAEQNTTTATAAAASTTTTSAAELLRVLFARLWASAQQKQQHMSKSGHHGGGSAAAGGKRGRRGADATSTTTNDAKSKAPSTSTTTAAATVGVNAFLCEVLSGAAHSSTEETAAAAHTEAARQLRDQLSAFFKAAQRSRSDATDADICAWWLLWKLFTVSAIATAAPAVKKEKKEANGEGAGDDDDDNNDLRRAQLRVTAFLAPSEGGETAEDAVALRAGARLLHVLPADALPPLLLDHLDDVLAHVIPEVRDASLPSNATTTSSSAAIVAAVALLLALFRVRPRLPAWRLLPHAQRLLVWLTHPSARAAASEPRSSASPSLCTLILRLCAAVAAHPLVSHAGVPTAALKENQHQKRQPQQLQSSPHRAVVAAHEMLDNVWLLLLSLVQSGVQPTPTPSATPATATVVLQESEMVQLILLLTKTWLRSRQQQLWSRPAMLPPLMCALFTCVMRGVESSLYTSRVLNVLAGGLAAMAAHVDAATAAEGDAELGDDAEDTEGEETEAETEAEEKTQKRKGSKQGTDRTAAAAAAGSVASGSPSKRRKTERGPKATSAGAATVTAVSAQLKRLALTAATSALFEVAQHYVHVFTTFSSDMDFLFTDFLRVLSQHYLPKVTRPPIAYHAGVHIGGSTQSEMTFADLAYMCVGNGESKSLLKQAAQRMEEEEDNGTGTAGGALGLTDGSRSIFRVA